MIKFLRWMALNYQRLLGITFVIMLVLALFVKAMYSFEDRPYFTPNTWLDYLCILANVGIVFLLNKYKVYIQKRYNIILFTIIYFVETITFIIFVPTVPISDMAGVYEGALNVADTDWLTFYSQDYYTVFPGNMTLSVIWGTLLKPFPHNIYSLRLINAVMFYLVAILAWKIAISEKVKYSRLVLVFFSLFVSWIMYCGVVYLEGPLLLLLFLGLYYYRCKNNLIITLFLFAAAVTVRNVALIFIVAVLVDYILDNINDLTKMKLINIIIALVVCYSFRKILKWLISFLYIGHAFKGYPIWNQFYIGINETEFGFMDNDFSYERSLSDVIDRVKEYGLVRMCKIIVKKTFWLWTQGTYQVQRYVFGYDGIDGTEKYFYETLLTKYLLNDNQSLRKSVNAFMRAQYLVAFGGMSFSFMANKPKRENRLWFFIVGMTFGIMLIYELKSRYIIQLFPIMIIMFVDTFGRTEKKI